MARIRARRLHSWLGVGAGLFVLLSAGTGTLLAYREELKEADPTVPEALQGKPPVRAWDLVTQAERRVGAPAAELYFSLSPEQPVCVVLSDPEATELYFAPSGEIVAVRKGTNKGLTQWLFDLHTGAVLGEPGQIVISAVGVVMGTSVVTGLLIWPWLAARRRRRAPDR
jgi:uncharacterized iron-regulated membrane protein